MKLGQALAAALLCAGLPALGQIIPRNASEPVQVQKGRGEFARKLSGAVMPTGKGWKAATDRDKLVQLMLPEKWKVDPDPDGEAIIRALPPGHEKKPKAVLMVILRAPADQDPLEVEERSAIGYADDLAEDPALKRLRFKPTDAGFVLARGLKFALAGGTMVQEKEIFQQEQLVYIGLDRVVSVQFTALETEFPKYADEVAKIFASYQNLGTLKPAE
jgi:hypothetical protein